MKPGWVVYRRRNTGAEFNRGWEPMWWTARNTREEARAQCAMCKDDYSWNRYRVGRCYSERRIDEGVGP